MSKIHSTSPWTFLKYLRNNLKPLVFSQVVKTIAKKCFSFPVIIVVLIIFSAHPELNWLEKLAVLPLIFFGITVLMIPASYVGHYLSLLLGNDLNEFMEQSDYERGNDIGSTFL